MALARDERHYQRVLDETLTWASAASPTALKREGIVKVRPPLLWEFRVMATVFNCRCVVLNDNGDGSGVGAVVTYIHLTSMLRAISRLWKGCSSRFAAWTESRLC